MPMRVEHWERLIVTCECNRKHIIEKAGTIACDCGVFITMRVRSAAIYEIISENPMEMIANMVKEASE